ncbi:hypothetical protein CTI14_49565 [Methylobacterium radiotolerans]|nr:hypothetical protein CTI14_49565 [Methylobacterium radiotolerans]
MAFRSRIKLFYRPAGLKGKAEDAPSQSQLAPGPVRQSQRYRSHQPHAVPRHLHRSERA